MAHAGRRGTVLLSRLATASCNQELSAQQLPAAGLLLGSTFGCSTSASPGAQIPSAWWNDPLLRTVSAGPWSSHRGLASGVLGARAFHASPASSAKDYYEILGVSRTVSDADLKKAYYKLAKQYHPDANKGNATAATKFQEVGEAYDTLRDPQKRALYDQVGPEGMAGAEAGGPFGGFGGFGGFGNQGYSQRDVKGAEEIFNMFFGGGGNQGRGGFQWQPYEDPVAEGTVGPDLVTRLRVSFMDAAKGASRTINLAINGSPTSVKIDIPAGIQTRQTVTVEGRGMPARKKGGQPGNLFVEFHIDRHPIFQRRGFDIHIDRTIDFTDALLGSSLRVPTIDGDVEVSLKPGTQHGDVLRMSGKGIARTLVGFGDERGDQLIHLSIQLPRHVSARQRELLEQFRRESDTKAQKAA